MDSNALLNYYSQDISGETSKHLEDYNKVLKEFFGHGGNSFDNIDRNMHVIKHVTGSCAIEGNTFTEGDTIDLLENDVVIPGKKMTEHLEILNLASAYRAMLQHTREKTPLTENLLLKLHALVLRDTQPNHAGKYKEVRNYAEFRKGRINYPTPEKSKKMLAASFDRFNKDFSKLHPFLQASRFSLELITAHPFSNGNKRTARLIFDFILLKNNHPVFPFGLAKEEITQYKDALFESMKKRSFVPFEALMLKQGIKDMKKKIAFLKGEALKDDTDKKKTDGGSELVDLV